ncbi:ABC transporter permease [Puia dinghuensis]|uniref:ABC transporter permease n=1 Tax=Puia dinghuensis TaxID=1792502 RepID=A0A8J2UHX0_9BACT|nr:ABC transporter permease [Puia dinghuensis]GGB19406.1 ABC transporter permease [Puia dinghuensis]
MLKSYLTIAWRHLRKNRGFSLINITGLGMGMAITLIIGLWVADEYSFDHYHANHARIAEAMCLQAQPNHPFYTNRIASTPMGVALHGYKDLFDKVAEVAFCGNRILAVGDKSFSRQAAWAEPEFPEMFTFRMIHGSRSALKDLSTLMISQSMATGLFGNADPIGKTVKLDNEHSLRVGGVFEDLPANTSYHSLQIVLPWYSPINKYYNTNTDWNDHNQEVFVQLAKNVTPEQATARVHNLPTPFAKDYREEYMLYPLDKLHLYDHFTNAKADGGRISTVRLIAIIGGFVLLLACINFMNLSTARSERRAKEVGIRKTVGSLRSQLIGQFLGESILVAFLSLILALLLVLVSLRFFNELTDKDMHIPWTNPFFFASILGFTLLTGLLAGSYPAFYLSAFRPVKVLKGAFKAGRHASLPRQALVILQFTVSLTLIIGTIIVYRQVQYTKGREIGYSRDGLITVEINTHDLDTHRDAVHEALLHSGVVSAVAESSMPTIGFWNNNDLFWEGKDASKNMVFFRNVNVSPEFGKTIGWKVLEGRDFSHDFATDSDALILNDTAARFIGFKDPIGKVVTFWGKRRHIIGVVGDMVTNSPYAPIEPAIFLGDGWRGIFTIRMKPGVPAGKVIAAIEPIFKKYNPGSPFLYKFNDLEYANKFEAEERIGSLATVFAGLAIFISCLGLFGLAAFVAEQRTKEIGVRKVLGAGVLSLWSLLSRDFLRLTLLSMGIAIPLAWLGMGKWLQNYEYHAPLSWWIFVAGSLGLLLITLITVSFQSLKAAFMNPTRALRSE